MNNDAAKLIFLDTVDSTNNYAMQQLNAQLAKHGAGYATIEQTAGKGQMGKQWLSQKNMNVALTIVFNMEERRVDKPFVFSAFVAVAVAGFFNQLTNRGFKIKWPNDIYWNDRKAGGILIENKFAGNNWKWALAGIGININQVQFDNSLPNPVSIKQITESTFDIKDITKQLYEFITNEFEKPNALDEKGVLKKYNTLLYKKNERATLKKQTAIFETKIEQVLATGELITKDTLVRSFNFGEISWVL